MVLSSVLPNNNRIRYIFRSFLTTQYQWKTFTERQSHSSQLLAQKTEVACCISHVTSRKRCCFSQQPNPSSLINKRFSVESFDTIITNSALGFSDYLTIRIILHRLETACFTQMYTLEVLHLLSEQTSQN